MKFSSPWRAEPHPMLTERFFNLRVSQLLLCLHTIHKISLELMTEHLFTPVEVFYIYALHIYFNAVCTLCLDVNTLSCLKWWHISSWCCRLLHTLRCMCGWKAVVFLQVNNTEYLLQQIVCTHVGYESGHLGPKITCKLYCGIAAEKLRFKSM